jgi:hypothetical protein
MGTLMWVHEWHYDLYSILSDGKIWTTEINQGSQCSRHNCIYNVPIMIEYVDICA